MGVNKCFGVLLFGLFLSLPLLGQDTAQAGLNSGDILSQSIDELLSLEIELTSLNASILKLKNELMTSQDELSLLKASLFAYQSRVEQLLKRSKELLKICEGYKKSSAFNFTVWAVGIPAALVGGLAIGYYIGGR